MKSADRILAQRYARAYDALSQDTAQAARAYGALRAAEESLRELQAYMQSPTVALAAKQALVRQLFGQEEAVVNFIGVLLAAKRYYLLQTCVQEIGHLLDVRQGIIRAQVRSACPLSPQQQKKVEQTLSQFTGKTAQAQFAVQPQLLGGLCVQMEDVWIDGSLKGRFEKLQKELLK